MKKQKYFINAMILDANDRTIGYFSRILELNQNSTKEFNVPLRAKDMVNGWNSDEKKKPYGVYATIVSFNKI